MNLKNTVKSSLSLNYKNRRCILTYKILEESVKTKKGEYIIY
jgi:hypothetical protein